MHEATDACTLGPVNAHADEATHSCFSAQLNERLHAWTTEVATCMHARAAAIGNLHSCSEDVGEVAHVGRGLRGSIR